MLRPSPVLLVAGLGLVAGPAWAQPAPDPAAAPVDDRDLQPEDGLPKPDPEDLRTGHLLLSVGGGVWAPSAGFTPFIDGFGRLDVGGTVHLDVGWGLSRHAVLSATGGYSRVVGANCEGCSADSIDAGLRITGIISQGFGFEPWASYGLGYRYTALSFGDGPVSEGAPDGTVHALDLARLQLGGNYYPIPSFGFGPYVGADIGMRGFSSPRAYAAFHGGLRVTFDPMRIGARATPGVVTASR